jgi:hypothetical protein
MDIKFAGENTLESSAKSVGVDGLTYESKTFAERCGECVEHLDSRVQPPR